MITEPDPNPVDDLMPEPLGELDGKPLYERKPTGTDNKFLSSQVGCIVQETRAIRVRGVWLSLTVHLFHLKGFGRDLASALKMARRTASNGDAQP